MENTRKDPLFKKGVWIREQQGALTIGSLDATDDRVMVLPEKLSAQILEFEKDMIEALYGEDKIVFNPEVIDIAKLLTAVGKQFKNHDLRISFSGTKENVFKGDYDEIFNLIEKLVRNSLTDFSRKETPLRIYINASVLQDHLCIIYRDTGSVSDSSKLKNEIEFVKTVLNGEISYKKTSENISYYDIMIPSKK